jgi:DNA-binding NarL/FixJ family response regulator
LVSRDIPVSAGSAGDGATDAPIRILIADDHALIRMGLGALISTEPGMEVVGEAMDGTDAVHKARCLRPDVIVLDLVMPGKDGLQAAAEITQGDPGVRILVLTGFPAEDKLVPAFKAGAVGYLLKDAPSQDLLQAIRDVAQGVSSLHPQITHTLLCALRRPAEPPAAAPLTRREREVACLLALGRSNKEIARALDLSQATVRTHITHILRKLNLSNRTEVARYALCAGLAHPEAASTGLGPPPFVVAPSVTYRGHSVDR